MPIGSAIGALGSIASGAMISHQSAKSARETNEYNRENYKNRYQWQVQDMRKAGLNPALSYTTGAGTPTGGVQQADFGGSQYNEASKQLGSAMSKYSAQSLQREQVNNAKNMNSQIEAQTEQIKSQTNIANMKVLEEILNLQSSTAKNYADVNYGSIIKTGGNVIQNVVDTLQKSTAKDTRNPLDKIFEDGSGKQDLDNMDLDSPWFKNNFERIKYERKNKKPWWKKRFFSW